jgi:hypothetical protein
MRVKDCEADLVLLWASHSAEVAEEHVDSVAFRFAQWFSDRLAEAEPDLQWHMGVDVAVASAVEDAVLSMRAVKRTDARGKVTVDRAVVDMDANDQLQVLLKASEGSLGSSGSLAGGRAVKDIAHPLQVVAPLVLGSVFPLSLRDAEVVRQHLADGDDSTAAKLANALGTAGSQAYGLRMGGARAACRLAMDTFADRVRALHRAAPGVLWSFLRDVAGVVGPVVPEAAWSDQDREVALPIMAARVPLVDLYLAHSRKSRRE